MSGSRRRMTGRSRRRHSGRFVRRAMTSSTRLSVASSSAVTRRRSSRASCAATATISRRTSYPSSARTSSRRCDAETPGARRPVHRRGEVRPEGQEHHHAAADGLQARRRAEEVAVSPVGPRPPCGVGAAGSFHRTGGSVGAPRRATRRRTQGALLGRLPVRPTSRRTARTPLGRGRLRRGHDRRPLRLGRPGRRDRTEVKAGRRSVPIGSDSAASSPRTSSPAAAEAVRISSSPAEPVAPFTPSAVRRRARQHGRT